MWVDCLNGDKYKTGKLTPDGQPDPSAFSTATNREGIQVGTAVVTLVRRRSGPRGGWRPRGAIAAAGTAGACRTTVPAATR